MVTLDRQRAAPDTPAGVLYAIYALVGQQAVSYSCSLLTLLASCGSVSSLNENLNTSVVTSQCSLNRRYCTSNTQDDDDDDSDTSSNDDDYRGINISGSSRVSTIDISGSSRTSAMSAGGGGGGAASVLAAMAAAERRHRQRRAEQALPSSALTYGTPQLRDPLGIKPPWRKAQPDRNYSNDEDDDVVDPVEQVWDSLSSRHQCFIDRWPPSGAGGGEEVGGPSHQVRK